MKLNTILGRNTVQHAFLEHQEFVSGSDPAREVDVQDQEAILPVSDSAREVRLGIKKVHVQDQEARTAR
jgi:hypothetical protein